MSILGIKSVPLMKETNRAWKTVPSFYFVDRKRSPEAINRHIQKRNYEAILNLGRVDLLDLGVDNNLYNHPDTVRAISTQRALRRTLDVSAFPVYGGQGPHWHKNRGFGGEGTSYCTERCEPDETTQRHVVGHEYRIVTVGDKVVQASRKGERRLKTNGRNEFDYEWIGVEGVKQGGFIPLLKESIESIPGGGRSVIGWDVIHNGETPFILEANTSPGVNEATAGRIISAIRKEL